jgi:hypothetical protein
MVPHTSLQELEKFMFYSISTDMDRILLCQSCREIVQSLLAIYSGSDGASANSEMANITRYLNLLPHA